VFFKKQLITGTEDWDCIITIASVYMKELRKMSEDERRRLRYSMKFDFNSLMTLIVIFPIYYLFILLIYRDFFWSALGIVFYWLFTGFFIIQIVIRRKEMKKELVDGNIELIKGQIEKCRVSHFKVHFKVDGEDFYLRRKSNSALSIGERVEILRTPISNTSISIKTIEKE
jgi:hypothetical protein